MFEPSKRDWKLYREKIGGGITTIFTFSVPFGGAIFVFFANLIGIALTFYIISILSLLVFLILLLIIFRQ